MDMALTQVATIHQQHALKCYLAIKSLKKQFNWSRCDWINIEKLTHDEPQVNLTILTADALPFTPDVTKRHWVLAHSLYPYAYFTMQQWFQESHADDIFNYYFEQCVKQNEYLSHNMSILISFKQIWPLTQNANQKMRFIERFCEFVTSTFYGNNHQSYPLCHEYVKPDNIDAKHVLTFALKRPGFWGHNLIALASLLRIKSSISTPIYTALLSHLSAQCHWIFEDEADHPSIAMTHDLPEQTLETACYKLLTASSSNLHQITLADSICELFNLSWICASEQSQLLAVLEHFSQH